MHHVMNPHYNPTAYSYWEVVAQDYANNLQEGMLSGDRYPGHWGQLAEVAHRLAEFIRHPLPCRLSLFAREVLAAWDAQDFAAMRAVRY